jgi:predicted nucleic acid-binding protein
MPQLLIDNSVLHAWANTKDKYHAVCKKFFEEHQNQELFFSIHGLFEFHASRARRIKGKDFDGLPGNFKLKNQKFVHVNWKLFDYCQKNALFEKFKELRGGDLIYACMAEAGNFTLVTCDSDFDVYKNDINLINLNND